VTIVLAPYRPEAHRAALQRIWLECGWIGKGDEGILDALLAEPRSETWVAELDGQAESSAMVMPGTLRYGHEDLPLGVVAAVNTGQVARQRGLAGRVTGRVMQAAVERGAHVLALGAFDRGFYDRLGFGSGPDELLVSFDPASLKVGGRPRVPVRLGVSDLEEIHAARLRRWRRHGSVSLEPAVATRWMATLEHGEHHYGLGYRDEASGALTHLVWLATDDPELGPYFVSFMVFRDGAELRELLALLRSLRDQVPLFETFGPPGIQLEDVLDTPFRERQRTKGSRYEAGVRGYAWWQMRIADLPGCLLRTHLPGSEVTFNLELEDPVAERLVEGAWRGVGGDWVVVLGPASGAERGRGEGLPTLRATVNAFTRLWLGVRPASGLAVTDALAGPPELLEALDDVVRLTPPNVDWEF
jgi:hypothetical protein